MNESTNQRINESTNQHLSIHPSIHQPTVCLSLARSSSMCFWASPWRFTPLPKTTGVCGAEWIQSWAMCLVARLRSEPVAPLSLPWTVPLLLLVFVFVLFVEPATPPPAAPAPATPAATPPPHLRWMPGGSPACTVRRSLRVLSQAWADPNAEWSVVVPRAVSPWIAGKKSNARPRRGSTATGSPLGPRRSRKRVLPLPEDGDGGEDDDDDDDDSPPLLSVSVLVLVLVLVSLSISISLSGTTSSR